MRSITKKPKILETKIKLANNFKRLAIHRNVHFRKPSSIEYDAIYHRYYWKLNIEFKELKYSIYFQRYVRKKGVDFIDIRCNKKALTVKEIHLLNNDLSVYLSSINQL